MIPRNCSTISHALSQEAEATKPPNPKPLDSQAQSMTLHGQGVLNFQQKKLQSNTPDKTERQNFPYSSLL